MSAGDDYQRQVSEALAKGEPIPGFPTMSPMAGLAMAQNELHNEFVKAGFSRGEGLYLTAAVFCGNPSQTPTIDGIEKLDPN